MALDTNANNFERGMKDLFHLKAPDVGDVQFVVVKKDNGGLGADWHLQSVELWHPAMQKRYFFICNDWLTVRSGVQRPPPPSTWQGCSHAVPAGADVRPC